MSSGPAFHGSPTVGGARDRRLAAVVAVVLVTFVALATLKPWSGPTAPASTPPSSQAPGAAATPPAPSPATTAPDGPSSPPAVEVGPLPIAFTTPLSPEPAPWLGLRWRRLAPDDPLGLVRSVLGWSGGAIAIWSVARIPATPVWTSADGTHWDPLPFGTSTTFWPGIAVLGVAELRSALVAATETVQYCGSPCPPGYELPVVSWTSADGRTWAPHLLPTAWLASPPGSAPLVAVGPGGMLLASSGTAARLAESTDGVAWDLLPADAFPTGFELRDLGGTPAGYVAVGRWATIDGPGTAAALWSSDGRSWSATPTILPMSSGAGTKGGSVATSLDLGRDGMIASGGDTTPPGAIHWWESRDGRHWSALPKFPPLGPTACAGEGCGSQPDGALVGDGQRIVAVRGGPDAGAWVSSDGGSWGALSISGDVPSADATQATLLPRGVLLSDGTTTWFGEAVVG